MIGQTLFISSKEYVFRCKGFSYSKVGSNTYNYLILVYHKKVINSIAHMP